MIDDDDYGAIGRMRIGRGNRSTQSEAFTFIRTREREREKVQSKCTVYSVKCIVHFIITLFNVGNVCYTISCYIWHLVLSTVSRSRGRSWNVLSVDTGALLYYPGILLEGLRNTTETSVRIACVPAEFQNQATPEYESGTLLLFQPIWSVPVVYI
jgi:hypothetical protein